MPIEEDIMKWIIGFFLLATLAVVGGLLIAGLIVISIALDEWSDNDRTQ